MEKWEADSLCAASVLAGCYVSTSVVSVLTAAPFERGSCHGRRLARTSKQRGEPIELVAGAVVDDDLAAIVVSRLDQDCGSQLVVEELFQIEKMRRLGVGNMSGILADSGTRRCRLAGGYQCLGLPHGEVFGDDPAKSGRAGFLVGKTNERSCVSLRDLVAAHRLQDHVGEFEEANQVGDGRAVETQSGGQFFLRATVAGQVIAEGCCLVDGIRDPRAEGSRP